MPRTVVVAHPNTNFIPNYRFPKLEASFIKIISKQSPCTAMDVVNFLNRDKAQVTRLIKTLIEEGFIEKTPNPDDKRSQCLLTTEKGNDVLAKIKTVDAKIFQKMTLDVSDDDLAAFQITAGKLADNLAKKDSK
ncbi:MarR family winged helix-turn-helix transcriptional regulator [Vibrio harveyi]